MASSLNNELTYLIFQFLEEENYKETLHKLEKETTLYFNMKHIEDLIMEGDFKEAEDYLKAFTAVDANRFSMKMFFELRKQKYLEALDKGDLAKAVVILADELKEFSSFNVELYRDMAMLLTLENFREHDQLSRYGDANATRGVLLAEIKTLITANPLLVNKVQFPDLKSSRLRNLINQSLNWQHQLCKNPSSNPDIKTLYEDHVCVQTDSAQSQMPPPIPVTNTAQSHIPPSTLFTDTAQPQIPPSTPAQPQIPPSTAFTDTAQPQIPSSTPLTNRAPPQFPPSTPSTNRAQSQIPPSTPLTSRAQSQIPPSTPLTSRAQSQIPPSTPLTSRAQTQIPPSTPLTSRAQSQIPPSTPLTSRAQSQIPPSTPLTSGARSQIPPPNPLTGLMPRFPGYHPHVGGPSSFQHSPSPFASTFGPWMLNPTTVFSSAVNSSRPFAFGGHPGFASVPKRSRTPTTTVEVNMSPPIVYADQSRGSSTYTSNDLPNDVMATLDQTSAVKSLDFHPVTEALLLVGTSAGDISTWDVGRGQRLAFRNFRVWDLAKCSTVLQEHLANDSDVSVNRVKWSPEGNAFGVAYSKHIIQLYVHDGTDDEFKNHIEIEAHIGSVNDLAFARPGNTLWLITCGEDTVIKVWDPSSGAKLYSFEGHNAPVYAICPNTKNGTSYVFSTSIHGNIKAWMYEQPGMKIDYDTPGGACSVMAYTTDGTRFFSCGMNEDGESFIIEWNEAEGSVKRTYLGLANKPPEMIQFDTIKNRFLVAGDDFALKYWDMDNVNMLVSVRINGLPACPIVRVSREGRLLAVSTNDSKVKVLANNEGRRMFSSAETKSQPKVPVSGQSCAASSSGINMGLNLRVSGGQGTRTRAWKITEISNQSKLSSLRVPDTTMPMSTVKLLYNNSGDAIIALACNAHHKVWKWQRNERNVTGKATTAVPPRFWTPPNQVDGVVVTMTNDIDQVNPDQAIPCLALSKNDSYLISSSGGKVSLYNAVTFKMLVMILAPPPSASCLAFLPQDNNFVAVGMMDASIIIYNVQHDELKNTLRGHKSRVTGLAFSSLHNVLVSAGADQVIAWNVDGWEKKAMVLLHVAPGSVPITRSKTRIQFHPDQTTVLAIHETQLAIFNAPKLELVKKWYVAEGTSVIADATFSCDGQSIYVVFQNAVVYVLTTSALRVKCRILPESYIPPSNPSNKKPTSPMAIAAHPLKPNQFAMGFNDGGVYVLEPKDGEGKWGTDPPEENRASTSKAATAAAASKG